MKDAGVQSFVDESTAKQPQKILTLLQLYHLKLSITVTCLLSQQNGTSMHRTSSIQISNSASYSQGLVQGNNKKF